MARVAFRFHLFLILCFGVSVPVTTPPVLSNLGGSRPAKPVSSVRTTLVLISIVLLLVSNLPPPPSRRGGCAIKLAASDAIDFHHCSPKLILCCCSSSTSSRCRCGSRRSAVCGLERSLSVKLLVVAARPPVPLTSRFSSPFSWEGPCHLSSPPCSVTAGGPHHICGGVGDPPPLPCPLHLHFPVGEGGPDLYTNDDTLSCIAPTTALA